MKNRYKILFVVTAVMMLFVLQSCNLPTQDEGPPQLMTVTPNFTLTALFGPVIMATDTPAAVTATPSGADQTAPQPTDTPTPGLNIASPQPTSTFTIRRSGLLHQAFYMSSPPVLDGQFDEWPADSYPVTYVVYGSNNWYGANDLQGTLKLGWDDDHLFIAVDVVDDVYAQNATALDLYKGDSLEINLDTNLAGDFYVQTRGNDDYQLGISPGRTGIGGPKEAYMWFPREITGSRTQVEIASVSTSTGYRVEASIPWSLFAIIPIDNTRYGFSFAISDNDNTSSNIQHTMISSVQGRRLLNPTTWGELILLR